jgi:hypothetical protein
MRVLAPILEIAVLPVFDARQHLPFCCTTAFQLIGDDDLWDIVAAFEELAEELLGGLLIPPTLDQNVEDMAVLIDRSPQIMTLTLDCQKDLIQMECTRNEFRGKVARDGGLWVQGTLRPW